MVGTYYNNPINQAAAAKGDIIVGNAAGTLTTVSAGAANKVLTSNGANTLPTWEVSGTSGKVIQQVYSSNGSAVTGTTLMQEAGRPTNTEGTELMTLAITPTNASNYLVISGVFIISYWTQRAATLALFQDATANALACWEDYTYTSNKYGQHTSVPIFHRMVAGTTSATTFKIRGGVNGGTGGDQNFATMGNHGGYGFSNMMITEISA